MFKKKSNRKNITSELSHQKEFVTSENIEITDRKTDIFSPQIEYAKPMKSNTINTHLYTHFPNAVFSPCLRSAIY